MKFSNMDTFWRTFKGTKKPYFALLAISLLGLFSILIFTKKETETKPAPSKAELAQITSVDITPILPTSSDDLTATANYASGSDNKEIWGWSNNGQPFEVFNVPFENGANKIKDYSDYAHAGTIYNNPTFLPTGGHDGFGAYSFWRGYRTGSYIQYPNSTSLNPAEVTVSAWLKPSADVVNMSNWTGIINKGNWGGSGTNINAAYGLFTEGNIPRTGHLIMYCYNNVSDGTFALTTTALQKDNWYHVVGVCRANPLTAEIYVNGVLERSRPTTTGGVSLRQDNTLPLYIGMNRYGYSEFWEGVIDDAKIYDQALSAAQIQNIANDNDNIMDSEQTTDNDDWQACITPNDGTTDGAKVCSSIVSIGQDPICGNGVIETGETCDDSNTVPGDGCDAACQIEVPVCGNGVVETGEECDDGNTLAGDGCSASCTIEAPVGDNDNVAQAVDAEFDGTVCQSRAGTTQVGDEVTPYVACYFDGSVYNYIDSLVMVNPTNDGVTVDLASDGSSLEVVVPDTAAGAAVVRICGENANNYVLPGTTARFNCLSSGVVTTLYGMTEVEFQYDTTEDATMAYVPTNASLTYSYNDGVTAAAEPAIWELSVSGSAVFLVDTAGWILEGDGSKEPDAAAEATYIPVNIGGSVRIHHSDLFIESDDLGDTYILTGSRIVENNDSDGDGYHIPGIDINETYIGTLVSDGTGITRQGEISVSGATKIFVGQYEDPDSDGFYDLKSDKEATYMPLHANDSATFELNIATTAAGVRAAAEVSPFAVRNDGQEDLLVLTGSRITLDGIAEDESYTAVNLNNNESVNLAMTGEIHIQVGGYFYDGTNPTTTILKGGPMFTLDAAGNVVYQDDAADQEGYVVEMDNNEAVTIEMDTTVSAAVRAAAFTPTNVSVKSGSVLFASDPSQETDIFLGDTYEYSDDPAYECDNCAHVTLNKEEAVQVDLEGKITVYGGSSFFGVTNDLTIEAGEMGYELDATERVGFELTTVSGTTAAADSAELITQVFVESTVDGKIEAVSYGDDGDAEAGFYIPQNTLEVKVEKNSPVKITNSAGVGNTRYLTILNNIDGFVNGEFVIKPTTFYTVLPVGDTVQIDGTLYDVIADDPTSPSPLYVFNAELDNNSYIVTTVSSEAIEAPEGSQQQIVESGDSLQVTNTGTVAVTNYDGDITVTASSDNTTSGGIETTSSTVEDPINPGETDVVPPATQDADYDGVDDSEDVCPLTYGKVLYQGCPIADKNVIELHTVGNGRSTKVPLAGVEFRVFDRNDADFQALFGKNPKGDEYGVVYETNVGKIAACTSGNDGICYAGEEFTGDMLVIGRYYDAAEGLSVYVGRPKGAGDFVDTDGDGVADLATKEMQLIKAYKKGNFQGYRGGSKTVVSGSVLEVIEPESAVWEGTTNVYPFIFNSDSNWSVDICAEVPEGYTITGAYDDYGNMVSTSECVQTLVANESKAFIFEVLEISSPEPSTEFKLTFTSPKGKKHVKKIKIDDVRKNTFNEKVKEAKEKKNNGKSISNPGKKKGWFTRTIDNIKSFFAAVIY